MQPQYPGYPPAQPQAYPQQPAPAGYAQPQQQYAPPAAPAAAPIFVDPTLGGDPGPGWEALLGRSVAIWVNQLGNSAKFGEPGTQVPTAWFDIYVCDGGPLQYGKALKANPPRPFDTHVVDAMPAFFRNQMTSHVSMYRACERAHQQRAWLTGTIIRSDVGQNPYQIQAFVEGDPRRGMVQQVVTACVQGTQQPVQPRELPAPNAIPGQPPAMPQALQQFPPQGYQQIPPSQWPQQAVQGTPQPQFQAPPQAPQYAPPNGQPAPQQFIPQAPAAAPVALPPQAAAAGMDAAFWAQLSPEQQAQFLGQMPQAAPQAPPNTF